MSPNKNYNRGRANEYKAMRILEKAGYNVFRSAGSHGVFDIIAYNSNGLRLIQCKTNDHVTPMDREAIEQVVNIPPNTSKELWTFYYGKGEPKIEQFK